MDIFQNVLVNTFSLIFVKEKGNIINSWYKKFIHVVKVFEIRDTETSNLSLKSSKNKPKSLNKS